MQKLNQMRNLAIPLLVLVLFSACDKKEEPKDMFVTVTELRARARPSTKSKIILPLPYGTRIKVIKTKSKQKIGKENGFWYKIIDFEAYLYGPYLSEKAPAEAEKKLKLKAHSYGGWGDPSTDYVSLFNNKVRWFIDAEGHEGPSMSYQTDLKGTYSVKKSGLQLSMSGTYKECSIDDDEAHTDCEKSQKTDSFLLKYNSKLNAFIPPGFKKKGKHQKKKCRYVWPLPDDESINVESGYFCRRKHRY